MLGWCCRGMQVGLTRLALPHACRMPLVVNSVQSLLSSGSLKDEDAIRVYRNLRLLCMNVCMHLLVCVEGRGAL